MPLNCSKRRKTSKPPQNNKNAKKKRKKQTTFPSVKTVSQHLSKCVKEDEELNILKRIKIATMRSKSQMAELPDEDQNKVKNKKQLNVKDKKQHKVKDEQQQQHKVKEKQHKVKDDQQHKVKDEQQYKVEDKKQHKVEDKEQHKVIDQSQHKVENLKQRNVKDEKQQRVKEEEQHTVKGKKQHKVIDEQQHKVIQEHRHKVKDEQQRKVIDEPRQTVKDKQLRKVTDEPQQKVKYEQQQNTKDEQQDNIKNKEQPKIKDKKQHKVKEVQQQKVEKRTLSETRNVQIASLSAIVEEIVEPTAGTVKKTKMKKISRRKTKYRILAKKFIKEYKYFCRLGELGARHNTISYNTTLWWMRRAGICDNHKVTFRDVEAHFINNLKRGYKLKILGFIRFLQSLCEDRRLRMSTVLNQMLSCRENNLIKVMTGRKPVKRSKLTYTTKSRMNAGRNQAESNVSKTAKKLEQNCAFSSESAVSYEKNPYHRERVKSASNALLYAKDYPTDLHLLKKWINPSVETDPLQNKDDMWEDMKSADEIYSNKKFSFDAELLRCAKRQKSIQKDIPKKPYASMGPCEIQGKLLKFTDKATEFISEEENYEYVDSDSSCDKLCQPSEEICQSLQLAEKYEAMKNASALKCDSSKTLIATKKDLQLNPEENGDNLQFGNSTDNVFQAHKCISIELINLLNDELKNSSTFQNDQDVLEIFQNSEAQKGTENPLIHTNKNENFSNDKCNAAKNDFNGDLFPDIREKTDTLESKNHETNSPNLEKISVDLKTETCHSQKIEKSTNDGKKSSLLKNRKLSPEVKINPTKSNFLTNCKRKPPPPPKVLKNSNLLASQKEHKSISAPKNNTLSNKNFKNTREVKLSSSCNKNDTSRSHEKLSITKNSNNSKKVADNASQDMGKNQYNENKNKMSNNKVPWNSGVIKFKHTQSKNNVSPNSKKIATTNDNRRNGKITSQKNDQRLSQKHKLPPSKNLRDIRGSEIPSNQTKNSRTFPNQDAKSTNNSKKRDTANSLSKNQVKIQRCNTRKTVELPNESKSPNNLEKVGKSNCPAKKEEKVKHCKTYKQDALNNGLNIRKEVINPQRDMKSKGILSQQRRSPRDKKSFNKVCKTKSISSKNTNKIEEESFSNVLSKNTENSTMLEEEISSVILSENKEEAKHSSVIPPENTKNVEVQEEYSLIISPKDTEDAKTLEEKSSLIILSKSPEETELIEEEHNSVILSENTKKMKMFEEENSPITLPKYTENLKLLKEESFLIEPPENTGNRKIRKEEILTIVSSKSTEDVYYERSPVIPPENTRVRKKEIFSIISPKVIENAKISKEESSPFTPSEHTRNENTFEDESPSVMPTKNTEEVEMIKEECSPVIPSENSINAKMLKEENFPIISSKYSENANMLEEKCFAIIPKSIRNKKFFEEESPPVISSENVKCSQMLEEKKLSLKEHTLKEDRSEYPPKESKKKADNRRTFTNLAVRQVQKNSKGEISEAKNLKTDKNKTPKEVMRKTQAFSDKRSTSSVNRSKISKNIDIACTKKVQQRHSAFISKATYGNNQDKTAKSGAKVCKVQINACLKTKTEI